MNACPPVSRRERIVAKVMERVEIVDTGYETPCWLWTGPTSGDGRGGGYARMALDGQTVAVHLVMWTNEHGYIPGKKQIDHLCRQRLCVRPDHGELVTHKQNQKRRDAARRASAPPRRGTTTPNQSGGIDAINC